MLPGAIVTASGIGVGNRAREQHQRGHAGFKLHRVQEPVGTHVPPETEDESLSLDRRWGSVGGAYLCREC